MVNKWLTNASLICYKTLIKNLTSFCKIQLASVYSPPISLSTLEFMRKNLFKSLNFPLTAPIFLSVLDTEPPK